MSETLATWESRHVEFVAWLEDEKYSEATAEKTVRIIKNLIELHGDAAKFSIDQMQNETTKKVYQYTWSRWEAFLAGTNVKGLEKIRWTRNIDAFHKWHRAKYPRVPKHHAERMCDLMLRVNQETVTVEDARALIDTMTPIDYLDLEEVWPRLMEYARTVGLQIPDIWAHDMDHRQWMMFDLAYRKHPEGKDITGFSRIEHKNWADYNALMKLDTIMHDGISTYWADDKPVPSGYLDMLGYEPGKKGPLFPAWPGSPHGLTGNKLLEVWARADVYLTKESHRRSAWREEVAAINRVWMMNALRATGAQSAYDPKVMDYAQAHPKPRLGEVPPDRWAPGLPVLDFQE
jgi:hypothetical protein